MVIAFLVANAGALRTTNFTSVNVSDQFGSHRGKPLWTCRKRKPQSGTSNGESTGRGRSRKRSAFYDAMKEYFDHFEPLLQSELEAEQREVLEQRRANNARSQHKSNPGYSLFNLNVTKEDRLFSQDVFSLRASKGGDIRLDTHKFRRGDLVSIDANSGAEDSAVEATVLAKSPQQLRVTVPLGSEASNTLELYSNSGESVSMNLGTSTLAYERAHAALSTITSPGPDASAIAKFLVMSFQDQEATGVKRSYFDVTKATKQTQRKRGSREDARDGNDSKWLDFARENVSGMSETEVNQEISLSAATLNDSQKKAIRTAARHRLTLIQGPPGTGKTLTTAHLIATIVRLSSGPVLACAASNVAADNLMHNVLSVMRNLRVVRVGRIASIDEKLWDNSLDCILEKISSVKRARIAFANDKLSMSSLLEAEKIATRTIVQKADVVISTCVGSGRSDLNDLSFPFVVIDEATQATETDVLIPIAIHEGKEVKQVVLVGDQCQLPPTVLSSRDSKGLGRSLFLRLWEEGVDCELLDTQYRMHPQIAKFPSVHFYSKRLKDGLSANKRPMPAVFKNAGIELDGKARCAFIHVSNGEENKDSTSYEGGSVGNSYFNSEEADVVLRVCNLLMNPLVDEASTGFAAEDIGVISPYAGQVRMIGRLTAKTECLKDIEVSTVDGFQGRENEVIIVSSVRSNRTGKMGFLQDWRRLNVAITRARTLLILVGDMDTLRGDSHWGAWMNWVKRHGSVIAAEKLGTK